MQETEKELEDTKSRLAGAESEAIDEREHSKGAIEAVRSKAQDDIDAVSTQLAATIREKKDLQKTVEELEEKVINVNCGEHGVFCWKMLEHLE